MTVPLVANMSANEIIATLLSENYNIFDGGRKSPNCNVRTRYYECKNIFTSYRRELIWYRVAFYVV